MNLTLLRKYNNKATEGELLDDKGKRLCFTLELPWKNNERRVSCISEGTYKFHKKFSQHLGWVYELEKVPDRSLIYIHVGNKTSDILGCILVGLTRDRNEVLDSRKALTKLFDKAGTNGTLTITETP